MSTTPPSAWLSVVVIEVSAAESRDVSRPQDRQTHVSPSACIIEPHSSQNCILVPT
jgi:hypothetical protein